MRRATGGITTVFLLFAGAALLGPGAATAQPADGGAVGDWVVEAGGGIALPLGDLSEVQDLGPAATAAVGYRVHPRVTLRGEGSVSFLGGADAPPAGRAMPDLRIFRFHGGADVLLWAPSSRTEVTVGVGAGAATYDTEAFAEVVENPVTRDVEADFNHTWFTTDGHVTLLYAAGTRTSVFLRGGARATLADADETSVLSVFDPAAAAAGSDVLWTVPVSAGVRVRF